MPRFTQFEPAQPHWPIRPAGRLVGDPMLTPCTLPTNPRAGQAGVNDPYFATDADRTSWISSHPTCTQPPPFVPDSAAANGQIKIVLTPPTGGSFPADLVVSVDNNPATGSNGNYLVTGLADGPHTVKITGTGIQPVSGPVTTVSGTTVGMPVVLAAAPAPVPTMDCAAAFNQYITANPLPIAAQAGQPPNTSGYGAFAVQNPACASWAQSQAQLVLQQWQAIQPVPPATPPVATPQAPSSGISWGTVLVTTLVVGGIGYAFMQGKKNA